MNLIGKTRSSEKEKREPSLVYINIYINVDINAEHRQHNESVYPFA